LVKDASKCAGEFGHDVAFALQDDSSCSVGVCKDTVADFEPSVTQSFDGDGDLML